MYKSLVALAAVASLPGCAGTTRGAAMTAEECKTVAQDNTDSHIKVRQQCDSPTEPQSAPSSNATLR